MTGTTYKRNNGTWSYLIESGRDESGRRVRHYAGGFKTKREADQARSAKLMDLEAQTPRGRIPRTFGHFLTDWLDRHAESKCSPKTVERYRQLAGHLEPALLEVPLSQLTTLMFEQEFKRLRESGGREKKTKKPKPLAPKTVRHVAGVVRSVLNDAIRLDLLRKNPASSCHLPPLETKEARALDTTQTDFFLSAARGSHLYPILFLAAATGCRRGELLALEWGDLDEARGLLLVSKSLEQTKEGLRVKCPKNRKARVVILPESAIEMLQSHRQDQARIRAMFGADYRADLDLIFTAPDGSHLRPDSITAEACNIARRAGLKGIGLHSLRHSHGSQLLSAGVPLPAVSKRLGHSSPRITAEVYSHALSADEIAAARAWDKMMRPLRTTAEKPQ